MKKKPFMFVGLAAVVLITTFLYRALQPEPVWKENAQRFGSSFNMISGDTAVIDDLSGFTNFEWDTLYSFSPYTPEETIYEVVGYRWTRVMATVSEGMNQIVFLKDGKVVCYIDGHPDKYKVSFSFGAYQGSHIKMTSSDRLAFNMTHSDRGNRHFTYVK